MNIKNRYSSKDLNEVESIIKNKFEKYSLGVGNTYMLGEHQFNHAIWDIIKELRYVDNI